jgi:hypothetical protein
MNDEPFSLYKFREITDTKTGRINVRLIDSLVNQSLYFAKPDTLNDPFDCRIDLQKAIERAALSATGDRKNFLSSFLGNPEFLRIWKSTFDSIGVCCFSRTIEDTLLWTHYADDHKGVCLGYPPRDWVGEHILIWQQAYGPVPKGFAVAFKDRNKAHLALDNFELISRCELMRRNTIHNDPPELADVIRLGASLRRQIRKIDEEQNHPPSQSSL